MKAMRKIVEIDEDLCNGCGQCLPNCAEGAIQIIDGKAKLRADRLCDGLGACLGHCPTGAMQIIEREADDFDEAAAHAQVEADRRAALAAKGLDQATAHPHAHSHGEGAMPCGCAGSNIMSLKAAGQAARAAKAAKAHGVPQESNLGHWPVKLKLVPADAPFLRGAEVIIAADCAPVAMPDFHQRLAGKVVMIACPKFDDPQPYMEKLTRMFAVAGLKKVTVLRMEVPCCTGFVHMVKQARTLAGSDVPVEDLVVRRTGQAEPAPAGGMEARML